MIHVYLILYCFLGTISQVFGGITLEIDTDDKDIFKMSCKDIGWSWTIYWLRDNKPILETHWFLSPSFIDESYKGRTHISTSWKEHGIEITKQPEDSAYWCCCRFDIFHNLECSDYHFITGNDNNGTTKSPPTDEPEMSNPVIEGAYLVLSSNTESVSEGQRMTLSCTINEEIQDDDWTVYWLQNDTLAFITYSSSTGDIIDEEKEEDNNKNGHSFGIFYQNLTVSSSDTQQNATFAVSSLSEYLVWNCYNLHVANFSNGLRIQVISQDSTTDVPFSPVSTELMFTPSASHLTGDDPSSLTYIIAGSVSAVIFLILAIVLVMVVLRWKRRKENNCPYETTSVKETRKSDLNCPSLTQENVPKLPPQGYQPETYPSLPSTDRLLKTYQVPVMEENVLYEGSNTTQGCQDNDKVWEENVLYGRDNGDICSKSG